MIDIKDTPWPALSVTTSSGTKTHLLAIARIKVKIMDNETAVYALVIPDEADRTVYEVLLGVPWLYEVHGELNMNNRTLTIRDGESNKRVITASGVFSPPNFKVMFESCGDDNTCETTDDSDSGESMSSGSDWERLGAH